MFEESRLRSDLKKMEEKEITKEEIILYTGFSSGNWGVESSVEKDFTAFFNVLKNNVKKEEHINWDRNLNAINHILKYLKEFNHNWNDILLIGHCLVEASLDKSSRSLTNTDKNTNILKKVLEIRKEENKKDSFINRDYMLLVSAYHGKPLDKINADISESPLISVNLKRRFDILASNDFKCAYCGRCPPEVRLELEHIIPLSKGGENKKGNLTVSCFECNSGKRARLLEDIKEKQDGN